MSDATPDESTVAPDAPSIWSRPDRGTRGPQPEHTRAEIAAAAAALADAGGLPTVSMRAVAGALGTTAGALYRYLFSRAELLDLMVDSVLGELHLDRLPGVSWLDDLIALAGEQRDLYQRHPWLLEASMRGTAGPNATNYFERCLEILAPLTCAPSTKMEAIAMMTGVVSLFARAATDAASSPTNPFSAIDPESHPNLTAALARSDPSPHEVDLFERTIRSVLLGLLTDAPVGRPLNEPG
ncbi:TetR/AcrR family transcriptional regulator [Nakamurella sp. GG22]